MTIRDFTFVCPTEILAFNNTLDKFMAINTKVIALSLCLGEPVPQGGILFKESITFCDLFIIDLKSIFKYFATLNILLILYFVNVSSLKEKCTLVSEVDLEGSAKKRVKQRDYKIDVSISSWWTDIKNIASELL
ncbi:uncharacterized protein BT62DRAFT_924499 [Guyanagaster necrorhizus]|uniref:Uncharacterized protein n=1 Tax=Guyanagaster necrorhizus TaxID=856835 RepID=A0A9P7VFP5_9AGAR|nr:uncharacterized protein BT62DRAFT_924499 [Guyanagaster necrorhizus MCA 3950]KAG7439727.1 hypothetical protein BT62DRAFT_924499 [Guyanagaster necrorhizus MCA 3950]